MDSLKFQENATRYSHTLFWCLESVGCSFLENLMVLERLGCGDPVPGLPTCDSAMALATYWPNAGLPWQGFDRTTPAKRQWVERV